MNFFKNINKKDSAATLVRQGMANKESVSIKEIADCVFLMANATGDAWKAASKEAAAGMVLIVLARNVGLKNYLNATGWKLVLSFVKSNPILARDLSPRTMGEIFSYQLASKEPMLASFAQGKSTESDQVASGSMRIAPQGHSAAHMPQPLQ